MNEHTQPPRSIAGRLTGLREAAGAARSGSLSPQEAAPAPVAVDELFTVLGLQAFPVTGIDDEPLGQVAIAAQRVDISVRGQHDDVFVHLEDLRDDEDRAAWPLAVEMNQAGEVSYAKRHSDGRRSG